MTDTRFWTVCDELDELIATVDIDGIGDIETLLMVLFHRPVGVDCAWTEEGDVADLEVRITGNDQQVLSTQKFPLSMVQLVRSCADTVDALGPYDADIPAESPDLVALNDEQLTTAMQRALGEVRLFKLMFPDEET